MKKYSLLFLMAVNCTFLGMYYNDIDDLGQNNPITCTVIEAVETSELVEKSKSDIGFYDSSGKYYSILKSSNLIYENYPNLFKKIFDKNGIDLNGKDIDSILRIGYPCSCTTENNKCLNFRYKYTTYEREIVDFIAEKKPFLLRNSAKLFADVMFKHCYQYYCLLRVIVPFLKVNEQINGGYYLDSIINSVFLKFQNYEKNAKDSKKHASSVYDTVFSTYLSILIEGDINPSFLNTPEGKEKLDSLNGEYFPKLKQMLENLVTK
jgi:hypothetical protein